jgi:uncharacterized Fe-S center protein
VTEDRIDNLEERLLVLRDKAAREGFDVPDEVLDYIAERYAMAQTLKGAIINVQAYASRRGIPVDLDVARLVLDGIRPGREVEPSTDMPPVAPIAEETPAEPGVPLIIPGGVEIEPEPLISVAEPMSVAPEADSLFALEPEAATLGGSDAVAGAPAAEGDALADAMAVLLATPAAGAPATEPEQSQFVAEAPALDEPPLPPAVDAAPATTLFAPPAVPEPAPQPQPEPTPQPAVAPEPHAQPEPVVAPQPAVAAQPEPVSAPEPAVVAPTAPQPAPVPQPTPTATAPSQPAIVWFAPVRTTKKESLVKRAGTILKRAGLAGVISEGDIVAIKLHFGEEGNTGFVNPVFLREVVALVREAGGKPFLTDANTLYRGKRGNAVDHLGCAIHNGFSYATVEAPIIIADGIDGREAVDVPISGFEHFDSVRIGSAAVHADAMIVVTHVKGHEATGFGGAMKNVGMGLGSRSAKQRMHSDLKPQVNAEKCTACGKCVKWCPVEAIVMVDRVATIDYELCYGCGECVAACAFGAIGIQWKTEPDAIQEKIVEHVAGALEGKAGKVAYLSFITNVSPDCDCWHFSDASIVPDVGVVAGTDIVAVDQASYDLVVAARGVPGTRGEGMGSGVDKFTQITGIDGTLGIAYAEKHGLGTRTYTLKTLE